VGRGLLAARAAVAVRAPSVAAANGERPAAVAGGVGLAAGALLGAGGVSLATVTGSVFPDGYGLDLTAALALAALLGGLAPVGPVLGTLVVWGPSTLWPLAPLVGTAPPLLVAGPVGLALLALRRGRPLVPAPPRRPTVDAAPDDAVPDDPVPPARTAGLAVRDLGVAAGRVSLEVRSGEVVALAGPNGAGKSTLLAAVGGQLDDRGSVLIGDAPPPRGPRGRARLGVARTWQRPFDLPARDVETSAIDSADARDAWRWTSRVLGGPVSPTPGELQLLLLAARRPAVALLDEPTDVAPDRVAALARGLADAGGAVLIVDHRPEVAAAADRVVRVDDATGGEPR
jgi:hypothetical protein